MQRLDVHARRASVSVELVAADLRAHEDDRLVGPLGVAAPRRACSGLSARLDLERNCSTVSTVSVAALDLHEHRVVEVAVGELADRRRHRRGEQRGLAAVRRQARGSSRRPRGSRGRASRRPRRARRSGSCDERRLPRAIRSSTRPTVPTTTWPPWLQLGLLGADRRAAEDGDDVDALARAVGAQRLGDLDAELAGRRQDERLDLVAPRVDVLDQRQAEGGGLAGAGLGLADHVAALEQRRDRLLLDRAGLLVADVARAASRRLGQAEVGEGRSCVSTEGGYVAVR